MIERHAVDEDEAFQMLHEYARRTQSALMDTAQSIIDGTVQTEEP